MPKLKLLILDAGVVIKLHEWNLWDQVISRCDIHLSSIVAGLESKYHRVEGDEWDQDIDLTTAVDQGLVNVFEVPQAQILAFKDRFDSNYCGILDAGEAESLTYLTAQTSSGFKISSGDAIVYKVLGNLNLAEQGISLEEVLQQIGQSRRIDEPQYKKAFRDQMTRVGSIDRIQGRGLKPERPSNSG